MKYYVMISSTGSVYSQMNGVKPFKTMNMAEDAKKILTKEYDFPEDKLSIINGDELGIIEIMQS